MLASVKDALLRLSILLLLYDCATGLIIPEEVPTILSLIYSNIPPVKKGTDSRLGVGFRLGEHADFQVLVELGPQTETDPIGTNQAKRRRDAMLTSAIKGDLGPLAQAVAKYQMERRIQKELDKLKIMEEKLKKINAEKAESKKTTAGDWLEKWNKDMTQTQLQDQVPSEQVPVERITINMNTKIAEKRVKQSSSESEVGTEEKIEALKKLHEMQNQR